MYDEDLTALEDGLRRLKAEYHIFFSGNRKKSPEELKMRVETLVKRLSECSGMSYSQRFRLNTLVTRFYVYRELWRRTTQEREMNLTIRDAAAPKISADKENTPSLPAETSKETIRISISDPKTEETKVRQLYDALLRIKGRESQQTPISYQQFAKYIELQTLGIQKKCGCSKVAFTISPDEDAIRFTAAAEKP